MKKHVFGFMVIAIMFAFIFAPGAQADTITGITLYGGDGGTSWSWNGQGWTTTGSGWWVLGVSTTPNGALVNQPYYTPVSVPFPGNYWLYAEPTYLGSTPKIDVTTVDLGTLTTIFTLTGSAGTESPWTYLTGSTLLQLGWASGSADKVGSGGQTSPSGINDFYLHLQAGTPVPLPGALLLFGPGLVGLAAIRRRFKG